MEAICNALRTGWKQLVLLELTIPTRQHDANASQVADRIVYIAKQRIMTPGASGVSVIVNEGE